MGRKADSQAYQAVVVGAGPNGLAAAIALAQQGRKVLLLEAKDSVGGGMRTAELTLPGFRHDICSAIHPMGAASAFFRALPLAQHGLRWTESPLAVAHPLDNGEAATLSRSLPATVAGLGRDGPAYQRVMAPLTRDGSGLITDLAGPLRWPRRPFLAARFGLHALRSADGFARHHFATEEARALWAGLAGHSVLPLTQKTSCAVALMLAIAGHAHGWPLAEGGSQAIADALLACFLELGGTVQLRSVVRSVAQLPTSGPVFFDLTPRQLIELEGLPLSSGLRRRLAKYRYGPRGL